VSGAGTDIAGSTAAGDAARDWQAVRDTADIQFAPLPPPKPPVTPDWLRALGEWLQSVFEPLGRAIGLSWPVIEALLIGLAVLAAALIVWRLVSWGLSLRRDRAPAGDDHWSPDRQAAETLLEDADRLAAQGRFAEAVHLLLKRSVGHIAQARPQWLQPASTAREIAHLPQLPQAARSAFGEIALLVERSRFALRDLGAGDWDSARAAYARFALSDLVISDRAS
jgi:hypothetical protein